jgi:ribosomal protein L7/L12
MIWYWVAGGIAVIGLGLLSRHGERAGGPSRRLSRGTVPTEAEIDAQVRAGRKIEAIKLYRTLHHVDLKAAKDAIDARSRELGL